MGILTRFKDIMSSNINALLDKAEDPEKMIDQCLRNMADDLAKVKSETAGVMAEEKRVKRELEECKAEINKFTSYAVKAVEAGNDEDARKFLTAKNKSTSRLAEYEKQYEIANTNAVHMREMHDKLVTNIEELNSRKDMIKSKLAVAKAQERINKVTSSANSANNSIASFERFEQKANKALDKANAEAELNKSSSNNIRDLEEKYSTGGVGVDDELAALKASLNK